MCAVFVWLLLVFLPPLFPWFGSSFKFSSDLKYQPRSPVFRAMLEGPMAEDRGRLINIQVSTKTKTKTKLKIKTKTKTKTKTITKCAKKYQVVRHNCRTSTRGPSRSSSASCVGTPFASSRCRPPSTWSTRPRSTWCARSTTLRSSSSTRTSTRTTCCSSSRTCSCFRRNQMCCPQHPPSPCWSRCGAKLLLIAFTET